METIKLYTGDDLKRSFLNGRQKGQADVTGDNGMFPDYPEFSQTVNPIELQIDEFYIAIGKTKTRLIRSLIPITKESIIRAVCAETATNPAVPIVEYDQLVNNQTRQKLYYFPMQTCFYMLYLHIKDIGYREIGRIFGGRKHDVVIKGARNIYRQLQYDIITIEFVAGVYKRLQDWGYNTSVFYHYPEVFKPRDEKEELKHKLQLA